MTGALAFVAARRGGRCRGTRCPAASRTRCRPRACSPTPRSPAPRTTRAGPGCGAGAASRSRWPSPAGSGFTRVGARLVARVRGPWPWRVLVAVALASVAGRLATLPFAVARPAAPARRRALDPVLARLGVGGPRRAAGDDRRGVGRRWWSCSAAPGGGARRGRRWPAVLRGRAGGARVVRLPGAGRAALQRLHAAPGRRAALGDPRGRRGRGGAGRRGAGRRRLPPYDDLQRVRVGLRRRPAGWSSTTPSSARSTARRCWSVVAHELAHAPPRRRPGRLGARGAGLLPRAWACWRCCWAARRGSGEGSTPAARRWCRGCSPWWRWPRCWRARSSRRSAG